MTKEEIIKPENLVYKKPTLMNDNAMHYCPGCSHGVVPVSYTHLSHPFFHPVTATPPLMTGCAFSTARMSVGESGVPLSSGRINKGADCA